MEFKVNENICYASSVPYNSMDVSPDIALQEKYLKIGIIGFGNFGQFIGERMVKAGHRVILISL